ncbi:YtxH domain-containing protein [Parabacteroides sp. Marseille-P3160]|uniref:YtxH domain-containing protein n=1 Tax=Parabacteroides sp. Marseille-P3160 TaxID=1917887 RepID=UPI0011182B77|nr:YtxH domain-containing protein [Parabacteroides sp. Marseille-P3160]
MKKILFGIAIGAVAGYLAGVLSEKENREKLSDEFGKCVDKAKNKFKDIVDVTKNKAEYLKERAETKINKGKEALDELKE